MVKQCVGIKGEGLDKSKTLGSLLNKLRPRTSAPRILKKSRGIGGISGDYSRCWVNALFVRLLTQHSKCQNSCAERPRHQTHLKYFQIYLEAVVCSCSCVNLNWLGLSLSFRHGRRCNGKPVSCTRRAREFVLQSEQHHRTMEADQTFVGGSFGVVYKAIEHSTGEVVAIKHVSGQRMSG